MLKNCHMPAFFKIRKENKISETIQTQKWPQNALLGIAYRGLCVKLGVLSYWRGRVIKLREAGVLTPKFNIVLMTPLSPPLTVYVVRIALFRPPFQLLVVSEHLQENLGPRAGASLGGSEGKNN